MTNEPTVVGRALVIEDDVLIAMDLADMLNQIGFSNVDTARDLTEADRFAANTTLRFVIADLQLGDETATPALQRYALRGVPVVVATGAPDAIDVCKTLPRCALLEKPYTRQSVETALRSLDLL
jgi:DNA-binding response OmpR family regulator